jgi:MoaA/NifB/PqqE/SkfB family radical SAM enzyme
MDLGAARRTIDRLRTLLDTLGVPDREIRFSPVGLGEPLLHPNIFEVIAYARQKFPQAMIHANTNGLVLKGEHAARLIASGLDRLIISLCYNDPVAYKESLGVDRYAQVVENAKAFLRAKGNRLPNTIVHIFDVPENSKRFSAFIREWTPFLNRNDMAGLYHYLPLTDWSPKPGDKAPCNQPWNVLMVDVEGYLFPCCIGVWTRQDDDLCLGHIEDSTADLVEKLNRVRRRHLDHDFRICGGCSVLSADCARNQWFHDKLKKHPDWLFVNIPGQDFRELP